MAYVLVNIKDESRTLDINNWGWRTLRILLMGADWKPMGATGHWDIMTDKHLDVPLETESDRQNSYDGCCLQRVGDEDVQAMLDAARLGISRCDTDPDGTFDVLQILQPAELKAKEKTTETIAESVNTVRSLLQDFAEFAEHGAFFID